MQEMDLSTIYILSKGIMFFPKGECEGASPIGKKDDGAIEVLKDYRIDKVKITRGENVNDKRISQFKLLLIKNNIKPIYKI